MELTEDERAAIRLTEQYRFEVQSQLKANRRKSVDLLGKVIAPATIVILSAIATGLVIPRILQSYDRDRRKHENAATLMTEITDRTEKMQSALRLRATAIDDFWTDVAELNAVLGEFALKRDFKEMSEEDFRREDTLMENDRMRVNQAHDSSTSKYESDLAEFRNWLGSLKTRLVIFYPDLTKSPAQNQAIKQLEVNVKECNDVVKTQESRYKKQIGDMIEVVKKSRQSWRSGKLTPEAYRQTVDAQLTVLHNFEGATVAPELNRRPIEALLTYISKNSPDVP